MSNIYFGPKYWNILRRKVKGIWRPGESQSHNGWEPPLKGGCEGGWEEGRVETHSQPPPPPPPDTPPQSEPTIHPSDIFNIPLSQSTENPFLWLSMDWCMHALVVADMFNDMSDSLIWLQRGSRQTFKKGGKLSPGSQRWPWCLQASQWWTDSNWEEYFCTKKCQNYSFLVWMAC